MSASSVTTGVSSTRSAFPPLRAVRFDRRDTAAGRPVVVLNARAATQLFGIARAAVGQRLRLDDETAWREVVGVVGNVRTTFFNTLEWRTGSDRLSARRTVVGRSLRDPEATHLTLWVHIRADRPRSGRRCP